MERAALLRVPVAPVHNGRTLLDDGHLASRSFYGREPNGRFVQPRPPYLLDGERILVRETADWTGSASRYTLANVPPGGSKLAYAAEGNPDPYFGFEARIIPENITLDRLKALCPRLAIVPSCDETSARAAGALLFNRSR